jgi:RNA polymerase primary sigma factor
VAIPPDALHTLVERYPGSDKQQLVRLLAQHGHPGHTKTEVNRVLYRHPERFTWVVSPDGGEQRLWYLVEAPPAVPEALLEAEEGDFPFELYPWQEQAIATWAEHGYRGVVEAVTGAGKTRVALAAAYMSLLVDRKVAVVAPTVPLVKQWADQFEAHLRGAFPAMRIGRLGGGASDSLSDHDVLIATATSASKWRLLPEGYADGGLLIADECHHYGAETWSKALEEEFDERLGLTATYDREDGGQEAYLDPYFGGVCYSMGFPEALNEGVVAPFKIAFVGTRFTLAEAEAYDEHAERATRYRRQLINEFGLPPQPFGEFMRAVGRLHHAGEGRGSLVAGFYLSAFTKRRAALAAAESKYARLAELAGAVRRAERTIVFAQTRGAAQKAVRALRALDIRGEVLDATMPIDDRQTVLAEFERGEHELVAAPQLLDEGIDVPAADLAIILASSRSKRQMIQRMGRVLRKKRDGRAARIVVLYVADTTEDPEQDEVEDFLDEILDAAYDEVNFGPEHTGAQVVRYLNDWAPVTA